MRSNYRAALLLAGCPTIHKSDQITHRDLVKGEERSLIIKIAEFKSKYHESRELCRRETV